MGHVGKIIFLTLGAMCMLICSSCGKLGFKYEKYSSKDPDLGIAMDYLSGWHFAEQRGSYGSFNQVVFYDAGDKNKGYRGSMVVTVKNSSKIDLSSPTVEAAVEDLLGKRMKFKDAQVLSRTPMTFLNTKATNILISYKTLDNFESLDAKLIPIKERVIIFKKNDKFYIIRYENRIEQFDKFSKAFSHIIKTLKLKEN